MEPELSTPIRILLVEDNPGDARLVEEALADGRFGIFALTHAEKLSDGVALLHQQTFDAILLDLSLPDSSGLDTLRHILEHESHLPVIVLTMLSDAHLGVQAVHAGAQDYLQKGRGDQELLARSIRYAIERNRLLLELHQARQQEQAARNAKEIAAIEQLSQDGRTAVTAQLYNAAPLRESHSAIFEEMTAQYKIILNQCLERRAYKVEINTSDPLREMAHQLGFLHAGPRDVVDIHTYALRRQVRNAGLQRAQASIEEGRLLVLELMGYLASYYRNRALGSER